jgi:hypothetical protein
MIDNSAKRNALDHDILDALASTARRLALSCAFAEKRAPRWQGS